jgi:predicted nucleic acid-binding protein
VLLVDTSAAVAIVVADHLHHEETLAVVGDRRLGLAGHAAFETYSVLTRLPAPARRPPALVHRLLVSNFPESRFLPEAESAQLPARLVALGIAGGAVYDALVAAVATFHGLSLVTRDGRAVDTYRALGASVELLT